MTQRRTLPRRKAERPQRSNEEAAVRISVPLRGLIGLALAGCFLWGLVWMQRDRLAGGSRNDFLTVYSAARLLDQGDFYDQEAVLGMEREVAGGGALNHSYLRTPLQAVLAWPLSRLPYASAYWTYQILALWAAIGFIALWRPPTPSWTLLFAALSAPLFFAFLQGQETPFLLFALAWAAYEASRGRRFRAGLALSLCALAPHLFLLLPVFLLARRGMRVTLGFLAGTAVWAIPAFVLQPDWPIKLASSLAAAAQGLEPKLLPNLNGVFYRTEFSGALEALSGVALAALVWAVSRRASFASALAVCAAAGLMVSHYALPQDAALLLPLSLVAFAQGRGWTQRSLAALMMVPVPFLAGLMFSMATLNYLALGLLMLTGFELLRSGGEPEAAAQPAANLSLS